MHEDIKWLFGLIIMFGVVWFVSGGYNKEEPEPLFVEPEGVGENGGATGDYYETEVTHLGGTYYYGSNTSTSYPNTTDEIAQTLQNAGLQAQEIEREIAALDAAKHASPLAGKITIGQISRGGEDGSGEYVILNASPNNTEKVLISGLILKSEASGRQDDVPNGVYLPFQNQLNSEQPIYLNPGEIAYIITGRSPIGISFKLNKCTGFYSQFQNFYPGLPSRCPYPASEPLPPPANQYNDQCLDYINSLSGCRTITDIPENISPECQRYVTTEINYTKCVSKHKNDRDFYDPEWRVYLNRNDALWKNSRELIHLLDQNGKIIDAITY